MSQQVKDTYSYKWTHFEFKPNVQKTWFLQRYGFTIDSLKTFVKDKTVLDAGCGVGWFPQWMKELGAREVYAVDFSDSVSKAKKQGINVVKASIDRLPFALTFDWVNCDQVIHHVENPEKTFRNLLNHVKPNGYITIYVYKKKSVLRELMDTFTRYTTTRSHRFCLFASMVLTKTGYLLTKINLTAQRLFYWNVMKCYWNSDYGWGHSLMVNYDWYSPRHAHRYHPEEVIQWFRNLKITGLDISQSGVSIKATKP